MKGGSSMSDHGKYLDDLKQAAKKKEEKLGPFPFKKEQCVISGKKIEIMIPKAKDINKIEKQENNIISSMVSKEWNTTEEIAKKDIREMIEANKHIIDLFSRLEPDEIDTILANKQDSILVVNVKDQYKHIATALCSNTSQRELFKSIISEIIDERIKVHTRALYENSIRELIESNTGLIRLFFNLSCQDIDSAIDGNQKHQSLFDGISETYNEIIEKIRKDKYARKLFRNMIVQIHNETDHHAQTARAQHSGMIRKLLDNRSYTAPDERKVVNNDNIFDRRNNSLQFVAGAICLILMTVFAVRQFIKTNDKYKTNNANANLTATANNTSKPGNVQVSTIVTITPLSTSNNYPRPSVLQKIVVKETKVQSITIFTFSDITFPKEKIGDFKAFLDQSRQIGIAIHSIDLPQDIFKPDLDEARHALQDLAHIREIYNNSEKDLLAFTTMLQDIQRYSDKYRELFLKIKIQKLSQKT